MSESAAPGPSQTTDSGPYQVRMAPLPNPSWSPGDKQPVPYEGGYISLDPVELGPSGAYPLVISTVVPRPIGFLSTISGTGEVNLSPYSYFGAMGHDPPLVVVSCNRSPARDYAMKDSLVNILQTGEFVVNIVSTWCLESSNHTCGNYDPDVDEFELAGMTKVPSEVVKPPRVGECAVHLECKMLQHYEQKSPQGKDTTSIVLGQVLRYHVHEGVAAKTPGGHVIADPFKLQPVSRLGGNMYGCVTTVCDLPRPAREAQDAVKHSSA